GCDQRGADQSVCAAHSLPETHLTFLKESKQRTFAESCRFPPRRTKSHFVPKCSTKDSAVYLRHQKTPSEKENHVLPRGCFKIFFRVVFWNLFFSPGGARRNVVSEKVLC